MVSDGQGGVHLVYSCKSAGLGGGSVRDGSANYYLMGKDTKPTSTVGEDFYTEGKVLGGFILAATEYERLTDQATAIKTINHPQHVDVDDAVYSLSGIRQPRPCGHAPRGICIHRGRKEVIK